MFHIQPELDVPCMKKGGKVKAKGKSNTKAVATANPTVHVHVTRRQGNRRAVRAPAQMHHAPPSIYVNASDGNMHMENQLMRMFQQMQTQPVAKLVPLHNQGMQTVEVEVELPEQKHNIQNIVKADPSRAIHHDLAQNANRLEQLARASALSHASHLPESIDNGNFADVRSIPFHHVSYGDEWNEVGREIPHEAKHDSYYDNYENFSYPSEPSLSEPSAFGLPSVPPSAPIPSRIPFRSQEGHNAIMGQLPEVVRQREIKKYEENREKNAYRRANIFDIQHKTDVRHHNTVLAETQKALNKLHHPKEIFPLLKELGIPQGKRSEERNKQAYVNKLINYYKSHGLVFNPMTHGIPYHAVRPL